MKKILFFILSISSVFAKEFRSNHSYQALGFSQLPQVKFGGYIDSMIVGNTQDAIYGVLKAKGLENKHASTIESGHPDFALDSMLNVTVNGINDFGMQYGAVIDLNANTTKAAFGESVDAKDAYIFTQSVYGKVEFGAVKGASSKLKVDAGNLIRSENGGIKGRYLQFINLPITDGARYILIPQHPTGHGGTAVNYNCDFITLKKCGYMFLNKYENLYDEHNIYNPNNYEDVLDFNGMENALKISFYGPEINGVQLGISYTPDTGNRGAGSRKSTNLDKNDIENVVEIGGAYTDTWKGIGFSLSVTGQYGKSQNKICITNTEGSVDCESNLNDLISIQYGGIVSFFGLSFAASIGDWGASLQEKGSGKRGSYTTIGFGYEFGPLTIAGTMFTSKYDGKYRIPNNTWENGSFKYTAQSINFEYKISKSFFPYLEITQFAFDVPAGDASKTNAGIVGMFGFVLNF
ncbi:MAG: porin [Rickettsiales bacterium]|jgi:hypothetical protein|nr:porin [Rickettsiales bacterium]